MASFLNVCRFNPTAGGTTDWTYSSAMTGYQSPAAAGAINGATYSYRAESTDLSQWEVGFGAYNSGTGVFARATVLFNSLGTTAKINFSTVPQVAIVALAEDLQMVRSVKVQKFTASGTYTPSAGMLYCVIECQGGGGGGGGTSGAAGRNDSGGGGGAGSYSRLYATAATIGASKTVTVGAGGAGGVGGVSTGAAGGDTSVGTLCIAKGGAGALNGQAGILGSGGTGGVAGTGDVTQVGGSGSDGSIGNSTAQIVPSGAGGNAVMGGGGGGLTSFANTNGKPGSNYGGGGGGAIAFNVTATANGGAGASGIVIITEYCTQ